MGGEFYKTNEDWCKEICMTRSVFDTARKSAEKYVKIVKRGLPAKNYYRVDYEALGAALLCAGILHTGEQESCRLNNSTEITTEITSSGGTGTQTYLFNNREEEICTQGDQCTFDTFIHYWNKKEVLPKIRSCTNKRKTSFTARMKDQFFRENWKAGIDRIAASDFCTGKNSTGWRADIDFFLRDGSLVKIMEGKYDNRKGSVAGKASEDDFPYEIIPDPETGLCKVIRKMDGEVFGG